MGKQWKQWQTLFWGAPKSLQMVTVALKWKNTCCLEFLVFLVLLIITILSNEGDILLSFWLAFLWKLVILSIFSCTYWLSVCLLWKNVYPDLPPILNLIVMNFFFFCYWGVWVLIYTLVLSLYSEYGWQIFSFHFLLHSIYFDILIG